MGRGLPWRKTLAGIFFSLLFCFGLQAQPIPEQYSPIIVSDCTLSEESPFPRHLEDKQGLRAPEVYSTPIEFPQEAETIFNLYQSSERISWLASVLERASYYETFIQDKIVEHGAPHELFFLPVIESAYRNVARSHAGAAGMWQFMATSGYPFGLKITEWVDYRLDFAYSTEAAILKLQQNYRVTGDWLLALAAYNCGLGRITSIMRAENSSDPWVILRSRLLPAETRSYIPLFLAVTRICSYPGRYGLPLDWEKSIYWETIELDKPVNLRLLAAEMEVPLSTLAAGNSGLNYNISPPDGYLLKIPCNLADKAREVIESKMQNVTSYHIYHIQSGDTLSALAEYYRVSVNMISRSNPGLVARRLQLGQEVVIPALYDIEPYPGSNRQPDNIDQQWTGKYVVKEGESLWSISQLYNTDMNLMIQKNNIDQNSILRIGTELIVPGR